MSAYRQRSLHLAMTSVGLGVLLFAGFVAYISRSIPHPFAAEFPKTITLNPNAIEAKAALVYDPAEHRILFQKNAATSLPLASLTKLMSAQAVLNKIPDTRSVTITSEDLKPEGDWGFAVGDIVKISDLIKMSLIASSNDAMAAAAASLGDEYLNEMNSTAGHLGLSNTYFLNPTGLDLSEDTAGAYGSAYDVARLTAAFMREYPEYFELTSQGKVTIQDGARTLSAPATALPLDSIPGFIGAKTGYTDLAGGNLVAAFDIDIGHPLIIVVLGSSEKGRFTDVQHLIDATRSTPALSASI